MFDAVTNNITFLMGGFLVTLELTFFALVGGIVLGALVGLGDSIMISGALVLRANNTGRGINESLVLDDATALSLSFTADEGDILFLQGTNIVIATPGAALSGDFFFSRDGVSNEIFVAGTDINFFAEKGIPHVLPAAGIFDIWFNPPITYANDGNLLRGF